MKRITITKVVTRNFFMDSVASIQNTFGKNLTTYERMIDKAIMQIEDEIKEKGYKLKFYRYQITELKNGTVVVMLYGDAL